MADNYKDYILEYQIVFSPSGLMEYLLEDTPEAKALRDHIVFKFSE